jgi:hypothetical protein
MVEQKQIVSIFRIFVMRRNNKQKTIIISKRDPLNFIPFFPGSRLNNEVHHA